MATGQGRAAGIHQGGANRHRHWTLALVVALGGLMMALAAVPLLHQEGSAGAQQYAHRSFIPGAAKDGPLPPPAPTPVPDHGPVVAVYIRSIGVDQRWPIELLDTTIVNGAEQLEDPSFPQAIAHYPGFGVPGRPGGNSLYAAHVNYYTGEQTPFARIAQARVGDDVYIEMEDGTVFHYTMQTKETVPLSSLTSGGMTAVVYPPLPPNRERVTFISCGGDFIPNPSGVGGSYDSRVILTAERILN